MNDEFVENVFETVYGMSLPAFAVPGVENLFAKGQPCLMMYEEIRTVCRHLCDRLGAAEDSEFDEDRDLSKLLFCMDEMCRLVGCEMFRCGVEYQKGLLPTGRCMDPIEEDGETDSHAGVPTGSE